MKKLTFFLLLLGSVPLIWNCNPKPSSDSNSKPDSVLALNPQRKVISIADFALQSKLQNADPKKLDANWLKEVYMLREMDLNMHSQLDQNCSSQGYFLAMSCCSCGSGCCNACDTTYSFVASAQVQRISVITSDEKKLAFKPVSVGSLQVFDPTAKIPDGEYILEIETLLQPPKVRIPIVVQDKKMNLAKIGAGH